MRSGSRAPGRMLLWVAEHAILVALGVIVAVPLFFVLLTAFMSGNQTLTGSLWPAPWEWGNFVKAFTQAPLAVWFGNSTLYAVLATVFMLLSSVPAAYVLAKIDIKFRNAIFLAVIIAMLLPPQVTIVPILRDVEQDRAMHAAHPAEPARRCLLDLLAASVLPTTPREYVDAARLDGCGTGAEYFGG